MKLISLLILSLVHLSISKQEPRFSPYIDVSRESEFKLVDLKNNFGVTSVSLGFALSSLSETCDPSWDQKLAIDEKYVIDEIRAFKNVGGEVIVSSGGRQGVVLESRCWTVSALVKSYERVISVTDAKGLDLDIESPLMNLDLVNEALAALQKSHPNLTISFSVSVMGDDYGMSRELGVDVITNAVKHGVNIDIINLLTKDYTPKMPSFGDSVIGTAEMSVQQMKKIWPKKSEQELYSMLGITPMIGQNDYPSNLTFDLNHAEHLVDWAKVKEIGQLGFWSIGRDKSCKETKSSEPDCSGISQNPFEFTKIFLKFVDSKYIPPTLPTEPTTASVPHITHPFGSTPGPKDCQTDGQTFPDEKDCSKYYVCEDGKTFERKCPVGTIWDTDKEVCNFANMVNRPECSH